MKKGNSVFIEIKNCFQCPSCEAIPEFTEDSFERPFRYDCKEKEKNIIHYHDLTDPIPNIPKWCPKRK